MTILIIIAILIAIAYIFGKRPARVIILGSGSLIIGGIILFLVGALIYYLWDQIQTNESVQHIIGVIVIIFIIGGLSQWVEYLKKNKQGKAHTFDSFTNDHPYIYLLIFISVLYLFYLGISAFTNLGSKNETVLNKYDDTSAEPKDIKNQYLLKGITNVRSCASINCTAVGQYSANTSFDLTGPLSDLPEWIEISWIDEKGETKYGYIHKSTLKPSAFDTLKSKSE